MDAKKSTAEKSIKELIGPHSEITAKLRQLYGSIQEEPLPTNLLNLLEQLDEAEENAQQSAKQL